MKLRNYTLRYLIIALLGVIAIWAGLFYAVMLEEVYDNIDDGLKNSKILIVREAYSNPKVLETREFGINQFMIKPLPKGSYDYTEKLFSTMEFSEYDNEDQPIRLLETVFNDKAGNPYKLTIKASMVEEDELLEDLLEALIALYVMLVLSVAILNQLILSKVWKSFYGLLDKLKEYKPGTGNTFIASKSPVTEFSILGSELEDLIARNEAVYAKQKQFIENASHELQTPLAITLNKLELFADNNALTEEQVTELSKISDTLSRLIRLNKSLLLLSKIENRQFPDEEKIAFASLVKQVTDDFSDIADYRNITLEMHLNGNPEFTMNKGLALALVSNMLKNAIVHNVRGGKVVITTDDYSITIANTGTSAALNSDYIFDRFYKTLQNEQSTGLGLAIVKSIAEVYNLNINYSFDGHHNFRIAFHPKK